MEPVIQTFQVTKFFKNDEVIKPLDFTVYKGEICALIGKNGAGKSTIFKMLSGQVKPTGGEICLFKKKGRRSETQKRMGFMIETPAFFPEFTAAKNLEYYRLQLGVVEKDQISEVLKLVGLTQHRKKKFKEYSMGMKQRLGIALCLLNSPDCLVLDEPINGLDAEGIVEMRRLLLKLNQEKQMTILVSSHILTELQLIATRFVFIKNGIIVDDLSKEALNEKTRKQIKIKVDTTSKAARLLEQTYPDIQYRVLPEGIITIQNHIENGSTINQLFIQNGVLVLEFQLETLKLEEYFLGLVGEDAS